MPRKLQVSGGIDVSSKVQGSDSSNVKIKSEIDDSFQSDAKIRCLCGNVLDTEPLVKVYYSKYMLSILMILILNACLLAL